MPWTNKERYRKKRISENAEITYFALLFFPKSAIAINIGKIVSEYLGILSQNDVEVIIKHIIIV